MVELVMTFLEIRDIAMYPCPTYNSGLTGDPQKLVGPGTCPWPLENVSRSMELFFVVSTCPFVPLLPPVPFLLAKT